MKKIFYLVPFILIFGCGQVSVSTTVENVDPQVTVIATSMKDVSVADADKIYKIFSGLALYIEQTQKIDTTTKVNRLVLEMEKDFGYDKGTYKDFSDAVKKFLTDNEGATNNVKKLVDTVIDGTKERSRSEVVKELRVIAQSAFIAKMKPDTLTVKGK